MNSITFKIAATLLLAVLLGFSSSAFALKQNYQKNYSKSFTVGNEASLDLECSFADVRFEKGASGKISVDVTVEVDASSEEKAENRFDDITIKFIQNGDRVEIKTSVDNSKWNKGSFSIDMVITMPESVSLDAKCSFGDVHIDKLNGPAEIDCDYGELRINELGSSSNEIDVSFGELWIGDFGGGDVNVEFGDGNIEKLRGNCVLSNSYGDVNVSWVMPECQRLKISCSFGDAKILLDKNCSMSIEGSASMGDMKLGSGIKISREIKDWNSEKYEATIGSGSGKINVDCSFGDVKINLR